MILDIDHIAISSKNLISDIKILNKLGYKIKFQEYAINNPKIKKKLLKIFYSNHDLVLMEKYGSTSIELINHHSINNVEPYIIPISGNSLNDFMKYVNFNKKNIQKYKMNTLDFNIFLKYKKQKSGKLVNNFIIKTNTVLESIKFWNQLGFFEKESSQNYSKMVFNSIINKKEIIIHLIKEDNQREKFLDDLGANCIAFLSHSIEKERKKFLELSFEITDIESIILNDKKIQVFFIKGPSNELVEIFSLK